jgi:hypothetical protein
VSRKTLNALQVWHSFYYISVKIISIFMPQWLKTFNTLQVWYYCCFISVKEYINFYGRQNYDWLWKIYAQFSAFSKFVQWNKINKLRSLQIWSKYMACFHVSCFFLEVNWFNLSFEPVLSLMQLEQLPALNTPFGDHNYCWNNNSHNWMIERPW